MSRKDIITGRPPRNNLLKKRSTIEETNNLLDQSTLSDNLIGQNILYIDVNYIEPSKYQIRRNFNKEELQKLGESMKDDANIVPIWIIPSKNEFGEKKAGYYQCLAGERRVRAAKLVGINKVKCLVLQDESKAPEIALKENLYREDPSIIDRALGFKKYIEEGFFKSIAHLSTHTGLSERSLQRYLQVSNLHSDYLEFIDNNNLSIGKIEKYILSGKYSNLDEIEKALNNKSTPNTYTINKKNKSIENTNFIKNPFVFSKNKMTRFKKFAESATREDKVKAIQNLEEIIKYFKKDIS